MHFWEWWTRSVRQERRSHYETTLSSWWLPSELNCSIPQDCPPKSHKLHVKTVHLQGERGKNLLAVSPFVKSLPGGDWLPVLKCFTCVSHKQTPKAFCVLALTPAWGGRWVVRGPRCPLRRGTVSRGPHRTAGAETRDGWGWENLKCCLRGAWDISVLLFPSIERSNSVLECYNCLGCL